MQKKQMFISAGKCGKTFLQAWNAAEEADEDIADRANQFQEAKAKIQQHVHYAIDEAVPANNSRFANRAKLHTRLSERYKKVLEALMKKESCKWYEATLGGRSPCEAIGLEALKAKKAE